MLDKNRYTTDEAATSRQEAVSKYMCTEAVSKCMCTGMSVQMFVLGACVNASS